MPAFHADGDVALHDRGGVPVVTLDTARPRVRPTLRLLGPAFVAAIAYVDPGNVATNTTAGARYGYLLVWVVVVASAMAVLVQYLSAKVGIVTGRSLPEVMRDRLGPGARRAFWAQAELVAVATDVAEVVGGAIALHLLFGLPLVLGGVITALVSLGLLLVRDRRGQRSFERLILGFLATIAVGFLAGLVVQPPSTSAAAAGLVPRFEGTGSVVLAAGMLGATVMPHAVYLHSSLARDRHSPAAPERIRGLLAATRWDVGAALLVAGAVNLGILLLAATTLRGRPGTETLEGSHAAVSQTLGPLVAAGFALALLASGLASTCIGAHAGAVIMAGLLQRSVPLLVRRAVTVAPALLVLGGGIGPTAALVASQVVLSFGIPFAVIPLVRITCDSALMGDHVNRRGTRVAATLVTGAVVCLNIALLVLLARS